MIVSSGQTGEHGLLPIAKLLLQFRSDLRMRIDDIALLCGIVFQIEQFHSGVTFGTVANDQLVAIVQNRTSPAEVAFFDFGMVEVAE